MLSFLQGLESSALFFTCLGLLSVCLCAIELKKAQAKLKGKTLLITGGSSGIGLACAIAAVEEGAKVILLARRKDVLENAKKMIIGKFPEAEIEIVAGDITQQKALHKALSPVAASVDILINCAGLSLPGEIESLTEDDVSKMMSVNVMGAIYASQAVVPHMKEKNAGSIVFLSSQGGQLGVYGFTGYSASKFALRGLAESLHMELSPFNVHVGLVFPPDTDTEGFQTENERKPEICRLVSESGGICKSEEVGAAILTGIKSRKFDIFVNFDGWMLSNLTRGFGPSDGVVDSLTQVFLLPIFRVVALGYRFYFSWIVHGAFREKK